LRAITVENAAKRGAGLVRGLRLQVPMTPTQPPSPSSTAQSLAADSTVAEIARRSDAHAAILDRHHLDFCCGGRRTLGEACKAAGLDVDGVLTELNAAVPRSGQPPIDWSERPLPELIDHIVDGHHAYTRAAIVRLAPLMEKVVTHHGERHPELARVEAAFVDLVADMGPHMAREEKVLFPYIRALANVGDRLGPPPFGTVRNPVRMMMMEHDRAAELLTEIQLASHELETPADACGSFAALYAGLRELRLDLLTHVSLENNVLFPRAIALEDTLLQPSSDRGRPAPTTFPERR
jgi:regulator of cell morphogenesis and NO signaling